MKDFSLVYQKPGEFGKPDYKINLKKYTVSRIKLLKNLKHSNRLKELLRDKNTLDMAIDKIFAPNM